MLLTFYSGTPTCPRLCRSFWSLQIFPAGWNEDHPSLPITSFGVIAEGLWGPPCWNCKSMLNSSITLIIFIIMIIMNLWTTRTWGRSVIWNLIHTFACFALTALTEVLMLRIFWLYNVLSENYKWPFMLFICVSLVERVSRWLEIHMTRFSPDEISDTLLPKDFGEEVLVRDKRESGLLCKYKKGDWSNCDQLTQVNICHQENTKNRVEQFGRSWHK